MKKLEFSKINVWRNVFFIALAFFLIMGSFRVYRAYNYRMECTVYIERAEESPNAKMAIKQLNIAIKNLEERNLTHGQVIGILEGKNNIGYFYNSLIEFKNELEKLEALENSEFYNVELTALQDRIRLNSNDAPWFISMGSTPMIVLYIISLIAAILGLMAWLIALDCCNWNEKYTIVIPGAKKDLNTEIET